MRSSRRSSTSVVRRRTKSPGEGIEDAEGMEGIDGIDVPVRDKFRTREMTPNCLKREAAYYRA